MNIYKSLLQREKRLMGATAPLVCQQHTGSPTMPIDTPLLEHSTPACPLPPELVYVILDILHNDRASLSACALVCRTWCSIAQRYLFSSPRLDSLSGTTGDRSLSIKSAAALYHKLPALYGAVRRVHLVQARRRDAWLDSVRFHRLLERFRGIQALHMCGASRFDLKQLTHAVLRAPTLSELIIEKTFVYFALELTAALRLYKPPRTLVLRDISVRFVQDGGAQGYTFACTRLRIERVRLRPGHSFIGHYELGQNLGSALVQLQALHIAVKDERDLALAWGIAMAVAASLLCFYVDAVEYVEKNSQTGERPSAADSLSFSESSVWFTLDEERQSIINLQSNINLRSVTLQLRGLDQALNIWLIEPILKISSRQLKDFMLILRCNTMDDALDEFLFLQVGWDCIDLHLSRL